MKINKFSPSPDVFLLSNETKITKTTTKLHLQKKKRLFKNFNQKPAVPPKPSSLLSTLKLLKLQNKRLLLRLKQLDRKFALPAPKKDVSTQIASSLDQNPLYPSFYFLKKSLDEKVSSFSLLVGPENLSSEDFHTLKNLEDREKISLLQILSEKKAEIEQYWREAYKKDWEFPVRMRVKKWVIIGKLKGLKGKTMERTVKECGDLWEDESCEGHEEIRRNMMKCLVGELIGDGDLIDLVRKMRSDMNEGQWREEIVAMAQLFALDKTEVSFVRIVKRDMKRESGFLKNVRENSIVVDLLRGPLEGENWMREILRMIVDGY